MPNFQNKGISTLVGILIILLVVIVLGGGILTWQRFEQEKEASKGETLVTILDLQLSAPGSWKVANLSDSEVSISMNNIPVIFSVVKSKSLSDFGSGKYNAREIKNGILYDLISVEYSCGWGLELKDNGNFYYYDVKASLGTTPLITEKQWQDNCSDLEKVIKFASVNTSIKDETAALSEFCETKNEIMKFSSLVNFDGDSVNENLVMCADSIWSKMNLPGMAVLDIYVLKTVNNNYQVLWQKNTDEDFNLKSVSKPEVIDLDKDGVNEIIISGSNWGGTCTGATDYTYIYSPKYNQIFSLLLSENFDNSCENIIKQPPEFSSNLELNKYKIFRDYLEKQVE